MTTNANTSPVHPTVAELIKINHLPDGHESSIFNKIPVAMSDAIETWLTKCLSQQTFAFLDSNADLLGIDKDAVSIGNYSILDVKRLDEHKLAFDFGSGTLLYNRVDNSVALYFRDDEYSYDMYFVYYPSKRQAYLDLGFEVSYYDPFTSEYKALFADISSVIDQLEYRLDLIRESYIN